MGVINTQRGYVASGALTEDDTIVNIGDKTVMEYDEWVAEGINPIGKETMINQRGA